MDGVFRDGRTSSLLVELLNSNQWEIQRFGLDGTGKRTLATITIGGVDVGDILISEGLSRSWPHGEEFWCPG